ncbi:MAG: hypothetical protein U0Q15_20195 [Kineosporiaceae bacterium]
MPDSPQPTVARPLRIYAWDQRPEVDVLHDDGLWYHGWLRAWRHAGAQGWRATVTYHVAVGRQHYREVPAAHVRKRDVPAPGAPAPRPAGTATAGRPSHPEEGHPAVPA